MASQLDDLRQLLSRSVEIAGRLSSSAGDAPPVAERPSFLVAQPDNDPGKVIDLLTQRDRKITFVIGAGASMEAGLPSWATLITRLLNRVAPPGLSNEDRLAWLEAVADDGLLSAAAIVRSHVASAAEFRKLVHQELYRPGGEGSFEPGPLLQEIAAFKRDFPDDVALATFNYDELLERALRDAGLRAEARTDGRSRAGVTAVHHLHGRLKGRDADSIVLSEADYARFPARNEWQEDVMRQAFKGLCVFIGLSFTDQNLLRWIYGAGSGQEHLALLSRQSSTTLSDGVRSELERATRGRLQAAGLETYWADFYAELGQLIHEARRRRGPGARPKAFVERAKRRAEKGRRYWAPDGKLFVARQRRAQQVLSALLPLVHAAAAAARVDVANETLGLGLWGLDYDRRELMLWASSDRAHVSQDTMAPVPLEFTSRWVAVEAVTTGSPVQRDPDVYASRWRLVRGIPLIWRGFHGTDRVPVGSVTLTSMTAERHSAFQGLKPGDQRQIDRAIHDRLVRFWN